VSNSLASFIYSGDELLFPLEFQAANSGTQIYIRNANPRQQRTQERFQAAIGYATQPKKDKRGNPFVSAETAATVLGFLPFTCVARR